METKQKRTMNALGILGGIRGIHPERELVIAEKVVETGIDVNELTVRQLIRIISDEQLEHLETVSEFMKKQQSLVL